MSKPECSALKSKVFVINPTNINSIDPNQVVLVKVKNKNQGKAVMRVSKKGKNVVISSSTKGKVKRPKDTVVTITNLSDSKVENLKGIASLTPPSSTVMQDDHSKSKVADIPQHHMNVIQKAFTNLTTPRVDIQDQDESKNMQPVVSSIAKSIFENTEERNVQANDGNIPIKTETDENVQMVSFTQIDAKDSIGSVLQSTAENDEVKNVQHGYNMERLKIIKITSPQNTDNKNEVKYVHTKCNVTILKRDTNEKSDASKEQEKMNATSPQNIDEKNIQNVQKVHIKPPTQPVDKYMVLIKPPNKRKFEDCGTIINEHGHILDDKKSSAHIINEKKLSAHIINEERSSGHITNEKKSSKTIQVLNTVTIPQNEKKTSGKKEENASKSLLKTGSYTKMIGTADHLLIHAPNAAKELQAHTLATLNSKVTKKKNETVIYDTDKYLLSGVKTRMIITHGYDGSADGIRTKVQIIKPYRNKGVVLSETNSDYIVKAIGQTNYETVMNGLLQIPNEHAKVQAIIALIKKDTTSINKNGVDKVCQTNESALREIEATKIQLQKRTKYNKKKPYVVTDKHTKLLEIGQKMNEELLNMKPKLETEMLTDFEKNDDIDERLPYDDNSSMGNVSGLTDFTVTTEKLNNGLKLLNYNINQVTKTDGPKTLPNLTGQNLFPSEAKEMNGQKNVKPNSFEQAFLSSVQSSMEQNQSVIRLTQTKLNINQTAKTYQPKHRSKLSQSPPNIGQTSPNIVQTSSHFGQSQPNLGQITPTICQTLPNQGHHQIIVKSLSNLFHNTPNVVLNQPNVGQNLPNVCQTQPNIGQSLQNIGQTQPNIGQNTLDTGYTIPAMYNQPNISQTMQYSVQNVGQNLPNVGQTQPNIGQNLQNIGQTQPYTGQTQPNIGHTISTMYNQPNISQAMQISVQNQPNPNYNGYKITMSDGYALWVPVKPEDEFHIATPENLRALGQQDQRKLILHQAYIDFKYALIMDDDGNYPIHQAVLANDIEWLKRQFCSLKMKGKNVDVLSDEGLTALQMSLYSETSTCCTTLIHRGADPLMTYDEGRAILHLAAERGADCLSDIVQACGARARSIINDHVVELQEENWGSNSDADLNFALMKHFNTMVDDQGYTPLMLASKMGLYENVRILLECQNEPELTVDYAMPTSGNTALYLAVSAVCSDCQENSNMSVIADNLSKTIEYLIEHGADLDKVNYAGFSPNSLAQDMNIPGLNTLLSRLNAKKHNLSQDSLMIVRKPDNLPPKVTNDKKSDMMLSTNSKKVKQSYIILPDHVSRSPRYKFPRYSVTECLKYHTGEFSQNVQSNTSPENKTHRESCDDMNSENEICNDINSKNESCNDINSKNESCNDINSKNESCNDINSKNESCNDINSKNESCNDIDSKIIISEQLPKITKVAIPILKYPAWRDRIPNNGNKLKKPSAQLITLKSDEIKNTKIARSYAKFDMVEEVKKIEKSEKLEVLNKKLNKTNNPLTILIDCATSSNKSRIRPETPLPVAGKKRKESSETETCVKKIKESDL